MTELDEICFTVPWSRNDFEKELRGNPLALYIVACEGPNMIGYAGVWCIVDEGHITNIAVHPDHRREGIGRKFLALLIAEAEKRSGTTKFTLEVRVSNEAAINLYEEAGFREAGRRKNYYSDNKEDAAIMWLIRDESEISSAEGIS